MTNTLQRPADLGRYQLMPAMTEEQFADLKADIAERGVLEPIEFDDAGEILDGHHRFAAFEQLIDEGHELPMFPKIVRSFDSEDAKIDHVLALNVKRRHLTQEQRAELAVKLRKPPFGYTYKRIAALLGVSVMTAFNDAQSAMTEEDKAQVTVTTGQDGKQYPTFYTPRFVGGQQTMRELKMELVNAVSEQLKASVTPGVAGEAQSELTKPAELFVPPVIQANAPSQAEPEKLSAFAWYGGKFSHLSWILPLLPKAKHFVDVFGGSASVLLNREPSEIETYNDLDNNVVNFFRVLRERPEDLLRLIYLTPYSREERRDAYEALQETSEEYIERARQFYVVAKQTRSGLAQVSSTAKHLNSWKFSRDQVARGMSSQVSQWQTGIDQLVTIAARLRSVQIENYPALKVLELYDGPNTLFYCDPPYVHTSRTEGHDAEYASEMNDDDHRALAARLHRCSGLVALSGYGSKLYDELYNDWHKFTMPVTSTAGGSSDRVECLWTNYPLSAQQLSDSKQIAELAQEAQDEAQD